MNSLRTSAFILAAATVLVGCAQQPGTVAQGVGAATPPASLGAPPPPNPSSVPSSADIVTESQAPDDPPVIDWDHPMKDGLATTAEAAKTAGRLSYTPRLPKFGRNPVATAVSDPATTAVGDRRVVMVYDFGKGGAFPTDGRVRVQELQNAISVGELDRMAATDYPGMTFTRFQVNGDPALLLSSRGIGRVIMLRGGLQLDITGPAVSPAEAKVLAGQM